MTFTKKGRQTTLTPGQLTVLHFGVLVNRNITHCLPLTIVSNSEVHELYSLQIKADSSNLCSDISFTRFLVCSCGSKREGANLQGIVFILLNMISPCVLETEESERLNDSLHDLRA